MSSSTAANRMNLAALQRVDSAVTEIVDNASQVALYKFASATNGWEKTEIEGALFVFAWSKTPSHGFIVMNRLSTTNRLELITEEVEFQTQSPFLLYKSSSGINCIWFYNTNECERVGKLCQSLAKASKMSSKSKNRQRCASESDSLHHLQLATPAVSQDGAPKDIVALLSKAKDQYNMKKAEASSNGQKQHRNGTRGRGSRTFVSSAMVNSAHSEVTSNGHHASVPSPPNVLHKPTPLRTITNGVVATATAEAPSTPLSVESLFAAVGQKKPEVSSGSEDAKEALLRALLSNPDNRLEHVERIQRKEADASGDVLCEQPRLRAASCQANISAWEVSDDLRQKLNLCSSSSSAENSVLPPVVTPAMLEVGLGSAERHSSPTTVTLRDPLPGREPCKAPAASDLPLLSPMAFTKPVGQPAAMPFPSFGSALFGSPGVYVNGDMVANNRESVSALTKDQLKDALVHMLQTDDSFLVKLHEAYVGSLKSRFNLDTRTGNGSSTGSLL
ncbi:decapping mRNA 1 isoform X1 [Dermacentor variabilis]|uniref:decapping mRNA 1 isoform X1 n=2 Tax=Dermacentor variabilis TaxID=34621 RepID=UPI003F5C0B4C